MNKFIPQSPVSVQSIASPETSETQSVNDEPIIIKQNRTVKKSKDNDKEKPPWRSTIASSVKAKSDRNALLKAKLLDASRRALRAHKTTTVSVQTDRLSTKLLKEVAIDVQKDLIQMDDRSVETDGAVTIKKEKPGGFILTQTIGQMTDSILYNDCGTQTALPKTNLSFTRYLNKYSTPNDTAMKADKLPNINNNNIKTDDSIRKSYQDNDALITQQMNEFKKIDNTLLSNGNFKISDTTRNNSKLVDNAIIGVNNDYDSISSDDRNSIVDSAVKRSIQSTTRKTPDLLASHNQRINDETTRTFLQEPTLTSWDEFNFDEKYDLPSFPKTTISSGKTILNDFRDIIIGQRLSNMKLSPIPMRRNLNFSSKRVNWCDLQHKAVNDLISEASKLIDVFDEVAILLGPNLNLRSTIKLEDSTVKPLSKWAPILTQTCDLLDEQLKQFDSDNYSI